MIGVLAAGEGWHVRDLLRAASTTGVELRVLPFTSLLARSSPVPTVLAGDNLDLTTCGAILVRTMPAGSLEQIILRMDALHTLAERGRPVVNSPRALECAIDKYLSAARLSLAGVDVAATLACETANAAWTALESLGGDAVLKPVFGSEGRGIRRVRAGSDAREIFAALEREGHTILLQVPVEHGGVDYRVFVLDGTPVACLERRAPPTDWITNIARGGTARPVSSSPLRDSLESLAVNAANAVEASIAGVDIACDPDGRPWVLEVNAVPGWRALAPITGIDIAQLVLAHLSAVASRDPTPRPTEPRSARRIS